MMRTILVSLIFICIPLLTVSQINKDLSYIRNYTPDEYNASVQNWASVQDHRGVMYFGNSDGVLEYDGKNWTLIPVANNSIVRSLAVDKNGTVFVGAVREFGYLRPNKIGNLEYVSLSQNLDTALYKFNDVLSIHVFENSVYFGSWEHIFKYDYTKISAFGNTHLKKANRTLLLYKNKLYLNNLNDGLFLLEDSLKSIPGNKFFADEHIFSMLPYDSSNAIIGTHSKGVFIYDLNKGVDTLTYSFKNNGFDFIKKNSLYNGIKINDTYIYGTIQNGLIFTDRNTNIQRYINESTGLQDNAISSLYYNFDKIGSDKLWITTIEGISSVDIFSPFSHFNKQHGLDSRILDSEKFNNTFYVSTIKGVYYMELDMYKNPVFKKIETKLLPWFLSKFQVPDSDEEILFVCTNMGLRQIEGNKMVKLNSQKQADYPCYRVKTSKKDPSVIFIGCSNNFLIYKYNLGKWDFVKKMKFPYEIRDVIEDHSGTLWLITYNSGIIKINTDFSTKHYTESHGLPSLNSVRTYELYGEIIFATRKGVLKLDEAKQEFYPHDFFKKLYPNFDGGYFIVQEDKKGNIWICRYKGNDYRIERIFKNEFNQFEIDSLPFKRIKFKEPEFIFPEENGNVWIGTGDGLYKYDSKIKKECNKPFKALLRKIILNDDSLLFNGTNFKRIDSLYVIENESGLLNSHISIRKDDFISVRFDFSAPFYEAEDKTEFSYMLEGYNDEWSNWTAETDITFTGLPVGDFTFHIKAKNVYGIESELNSYSFNIYPPWYASVWAVIAYSIFILWIAVKLYNRKLIKEKNKLERIVFERTSELNQKNEILISQKEEISIQRDNLDDLNKQLEDQKEKIAGQRDEIKEELKETLGKTQALKKDNFKFQIKSIANQLNPHFIFNTLAALKHFILKNDIESSDKYLEKFSELMRLTLYNSLEDAIPLENEVEVLSLYLDLEKLMSRDKFSYSIKIDEDLDMKYDRIPSMLIQPFIENSLIHGIYNKKGKGEIKMSFGKKGKSIVCLIEDNGIGLRKAEEIKKKRKGTHISVGTSLIKDRLKLISELYNKDYSFKYSDIKDIKGKTEGTKVEIEIPIIE